MTKEDVLRLAREAGFNTDGEVVVGQYCDNITKEVTQLIVLVAGLCAGLCAETAEAVTYQTDAQSAAEKCGDAIRVRFGISA